MKIKRVIINNFRAFKHEEFEFADFNCIIGKNDSGKSTILAALEWFFNEGKFEKEDTNVNVGDENEDVSVEIYFSQVDFSDELFDKDFLDENKNVRISKIITNPRFMDSDIVKPIPYYSMQTNCFDNRNKIFSDCSLEELMEECIELNIKVDFYREKLTELKKYQENKGMKIVPNDFQKYISQTRNELYNYYNSNNYKIIKDRKTFNEEKWFEWTKEKTIFCVPSLVSYTPLTPIKKYLNDLFNYHFCFDDRKTQNIADEISNKIYDDTGINCSLFFDYLDCDFFPDEKKLPLKIENDLETIPVRNRGYGFQQIIKNAVFRIFAKKQYGSGIFTFEEPETGLHPSAQTDMYEAIKKISENPECQVIITTHSPYIVKELSKANINPIVVKRDEKENVSTISKTEGRVLPYVSMNEINYIAFDLPSIEYHQELFARLQNESKTVDGVDGMFEKEYDWYQIDKKGKLLFKDGAEIKRTHSLPYCVRNQIDHPNPKNEQYTNDYLIKKSIEIMRKAIIEGIN